MLVHARRCAVLIPPLILALSACSTGPYRSAVKNFASGVQDAAGAAQTEMKQSVADGQADAALYGALWLKNKRPDLSMSDDCEDIILPVAARTPASAGKSDAQLAEACAVHDSRRPTLHVIPKFEQSFARADTREARRMAGTLLGYSEGLLAITNAEDYEGLRKATSGLGTSLGQLAALAGPKGVAAGAVIGPLANIAGEIAIVGLEARRFRLMKRMVLETDDAIGTLSSTLDNKLKPLRRARLTAAYSVLTQRVEEWNRSKRDEKAAKRLSQAMIDYRNQARNYARPLPFRGLSTAHGKLVALMKEDLTEEQIAELFTTIGNFQEAAKELVAAVQELGG